MGTYDIDRGNLEAMRLQVSRYLNLLDGILSGAVLVDGSRAMTGPLSMTGENTVDGSPIYHEGQFRLHHTGGWVHDGSTTAADPGGKAMRSDSLALASITKLYLDQASVNYTFFGAFSELLVGDEVYISAINNNNRGRYSITGVTNNSGWWTIDVTPISGPAGSFAADDLVSIDFVMQRTDTLLQDGSRTITGTTTFGAGARLKQSDSAGNEWPSLPMRAEVRTSDLAITSATTGTTLVNLIASGADGGIYMKANGVAFGTLNILWSAHVTPDIKFGWSYPSGCSINWGLSSGSAGTLIETGTSPLGGAGVTTLHSTMYKFVIRNGATAGYVYPQVAQNTSDANATTVFAGTGMEARTSV